MNKIKSFLKSLITGLLKQFNWEWLVDIALTLLIKLVSNWAGDQQLSIKQIKLVRGLDGFNRDYLADVVDDNNYEYDNKLQQGFIETAKKLSKKNNFKLYEIEQI